MNLLLTTCNLDLTYNFVMILRKLPYKVYLLMPNEKSTLYTKNLLVDGHVTYDRDEMGYDYHPKYQHLMNNLFI